MSDFYLWPTKAQADAALANINAHFPIQGRNAATGELVDNWTACWCEAPAQTTDGRWGFQRISASVLDAMGISEAQRVAWLAAFAPEIVSNPVFPSPPSDTE